MGMLKPKLMFVLARFRGMKGLPNFPQIMRSEAK